MLRPTWRAIALSAGALPAVMVALAAATSTGCAAEEVQSAEDVHSVRSSVQPPRVEGQLIVNGESVELPNLSVIDKSPQSSTEQSLWIVFAAESTEGRGRSVPSKEAAHVEVVITGSRDLELHGLLEMGGPAQVSQNVKLSESHNLLAGGARPSVEITAGGPDHLEGRVWLDQPVTTANGDTFVYDLRFAASIERSGG